MQCECCRTVVLNAVLTCNGFRCLHVVMWFIWSCKAAKADRHIAVIVVGVESTIVHAGFSGRLHALQAIA